MITPNCSKSLVFERSNIGKGEIHVPYKTPIYRCVYVCFPGIKYTLLETDLEHKFLADWQSQYKN